MIRTRQIALALVFVAGAAERMPAQGQQNAEQILVQRARLLDSQGRHDLAADNWRQLLLVEPRNEEALTDLVHYYRSIGDKAHSQQYEQALRRIHPNGALPAAPSLQPGESIDSLLRLASRQSAERQNAAALATYQKAFGSSQPPDDWAVAYYQAESAIPASEAHALAGLRALVQKYPANPSYRLALAKVLTYRPATRLEGAQMLQHFQGSPEQNEEARTAWKQAILWDTSAPAAVRTWKDYLARYPDAELTARIASGTKVAAARPKQDSPLEGDAYKALASGDLPEAEQRFIELASEPGHTGQSEAGLGYVSMKKKEFDKAVQHFEQAHAAGFKNSSMEKALQEARYWNAMANGSSALGANETGKASAEFEKARQVKATAPEATEALGGTLLAQKEPERAEALFASELKTNQHRPDAWIGWINAALDAGHADQVLARQKQIPTDVASSLNNRPDYLALIASAHLAVNDSAPATQIIDRLSKMSGPATPVNSAALVMAAGLLVAHGYFDQAARICVSAIKVDPKNAEAWQTLVEAEHAAGRDDNAAEIATRIPSSVDEAAVKNPNFLIALSAVYQAKHRLATASTLLDNAARIPGLSPAAALRVKLQMASLALAQGDPHKAYTLYAAVARDFSDNTEAWSGMVTALHTAQHDAESLATLENLPRPVSARLRRDPAFLETAAFIYSENGRSREATLCLTAVTQQYARQHKPVPFSVDSAYGWLLLNAGKDQDLAAVLARLARTPGLTAAQGSEIEQIWIAWSTRRADAAFKAGDSRRAVTILETAVAAFPQQVPARVALANMYMRAGNSGAALRIFTQLNWEHASVDQYESAINCALANHNLKYAEFWLKRGLADHPDDPTLIRAAARTEEQRGDLKRAGQYLARLRSGALPPLRDEPVQEIPSSERAQENVPAPPAAVPPQSALEALLMDTPSVGANGPQSIATPPPFSTEGTGGHVQLQSSGPETRLSPSANGNARMVQAAWPGEQPLVSTSGQTSADGWLQGLLSNSGPTKELEPADLKPSDSAARGFRPDSAQESPATASILDEILRMPTEQSRATFADGLEGTGGISSNLPRETVTPMTAMLSPVPVFPVTNTAQQQAEDELAQLQSRYSPFMGTGASVRVHSGTVGFDHLLDFETQIEGSAAVGSGARVTFIAHPVLLQAGTPNATSNYRFGSGSTAPTTPQFASGIGGEVQMAAGWIKASAGISPWNFLVRNGVGSIALQPANGPITFRAYRSTVKDSLLSYAGMQDPATGKIWGGVVATGAGVDLSRGTEESGFYASVAGESITGLNVTDNKRIYGDAGAYWQVYTSPAGTLKMGANLNAMHYSLNQRYFTFGQGGYFSPSGFLVANSPFTWEGHPARNTYYSITGSIGIQNIQQDQAMTGSLLVGDGIETRTGAGYDLHVRVTHRFSSHWDLQGFADTNNAQQYAERTVGFSVRYLRFPQPEQSAPSGFLNDSDVRPLKLP